MSAAPFRPPVYHRNGAALYPSQFHSAPFKEIPPHLSHPLLKTSNYTAKYANIVDIDKYLKLFRGVQLSPGNQLWDVHDTEFQNLALRLTQDFNEKEWQSKHSIGIVILLRARSYAIGSRRDVDWSGRMIDQADIFRSQKQIELEEQWCSLELFDWAQQPGGFQEGQGGGARKAMKVTVVNEDTQQAAERLLEEYKGHIGADQLSILNMANAHNVGGGYQAVNGSQEENVGGNATFLATLGLLGEINTKEQRLIGRATYRAGFHIPPGGNYFLKTRFVTGRNGACNCITHAFADFRRGNSHHEGDEYKKGSPEYLERIKLDVDGVLKTAIAKKQEVLVLSASGCGAFQHDPTMEADAWRDALKDPQFAGHFTEVCFAILGNTNFKAFQKGLKSLSAL